MQLSAGRGAAAMLGLALAMLAGLAVAQTPGAAAPERIAIGLLDQLDAGDYAAAVAGFSPEMAAAVPAAKLRAVWESLPVQAGAALGRGDPVVVMQDGLQLVTIPLRYAKVALLAKTAITAQGKVAGFVIQPAPPPAAPAPAADAGFSERELQVGAGERALPATLALPDGKRHPPGKDVPGVVLVHGSGPQDRDETTGPNRPFLDIARGLAAQGIAVLRYEKRSKARPQDFADGKFTVDDETTNDAVAAVALLRTLPGIDPARVFVLGHSQGAMLAPRIAQRAGRIAGLVLLAAPARPLLDILVEQNKRMSVLDDGKTSAEEAVALEALKQQVAAVRDGAELPAARLPLGQPAGYWRSIEAVDPVADAKALGKPMLVLQGARDIQVVDADWQRWKAAFQDDPQVTFKLYPTLNHLGIAVTADSGLAAYATPGQVDAQLIADVAAWIAAR